MKLSLEGKKVLVTGASSGLGLEMARQLARDHKAHPVLVARRRERLVALAEELRAHGVSPEVVAADLSKPEDLERCFGEATALGVDAVILNAGVTWFGRTLEHPLPDVTNLVATNVTAVVSLCQRFVPWLLAKGTSGAVMLVSSMAGFQPMPFQAVYGGSKAFVTSYGLALSEELRDRDVSVTVFCPGGIATEMMESAGFSTKYPKGHPMVMDVEPCARLALGAMIARKRVFVPGGLNKVAAFFAQVSPTKLVTRLVANDYRGALPALPR
jgi:hypothetical protein